MNGQDRTGWRIAAGRTGRRRGRARSAPAQRTGSAAGVTSRLLSEPTRGGVATDARRTAAAPHRVDQRQIQVDRAVTRLHGSSDVEVSHGSQGGGGIIVTLRVARAVGKGAVR